MYSYKERIRYSETDSSLYLSYLALVNFFQDAAILEAQNESVSIEELYEEKNAWLLGAWQIQIEKRPFLNDLVTITTFPYEFKGFLGYRNFTLKDENENILVKAASIWSLMNLETLKPARVSEDLKTRYDIREKLEMDYKPRRITLEGEAKPQKAIDVKKLHIDSNQHMNNSAYVGIALEYLPQGKELSQIRVEYKLAAYLGEKITPVIYENENIITVELTGQQGTYAIVEMTCI